MDGFTLVVANGEWPSEELLTTLLDKADFTIALDGAAVPIHHEGFITPHYSQDDDDPNRFADLPQPSSTPLQPEVHLDPPRTADYQDEHDYQEALRIYRSRREFQYVQRFAGGRPCSCLA